MSNKKTLGNDLTQGKVTKTMIKFAMPFLLANLLQTLYGIVDLFIVGRYTDSEQLAAVSVASLIMMMINSSVMGLGVGGTVVIGQFLGAKKQKDVDETISACFVVYPVTALIFLVLMIFFRSNLLHLINTPVESFPYAEEYLRICMIGLVFTGIYNAIASVLRGLGDSSGPTIFSASACICNMIGDYILVKDFGMGAYGAALATTVSQGLSVVIGYFYLKRHNFPFKLRPSSFYVRRDKLRLLLKMGIPVAAQETLLSISFLALESILNGLGFIAVAASGVCDRIFNVAVVPALAFSSAIAAMVAQNEGACEYGRSYRCLSVGLVFSISVSVTIFLVMTFFPGAVVSVFTHDELVIADGIKYLVFYKFDYLVCAVAFCFNGYINGIGHTQYTMYSNLISSLLVRVPLVYFVSLIPGVTLYEIGICLPCASLVQLFLSIGFVLLAKSERGRRKALRAK